MEEFLRALATGGVTGIILGGVIYFIGRRLLGLEEAIDRLVRLDLLRLIASPHVSPEVKDAASDLLEEVKTAESRRDK